MIVNICWLDRVVYSFTSLFLAFVKNSNTNHSTPFLARWGPQYCATPWAGSRRHLSCSPTARVVAHREVSTIADSPHRTSRCTGMNDAIAFPHCSHLFWWASCPIDYPSVRVRAVSPVLPTPALGPCKMQNSGCAVKTTSAAASLRALPSSQLTSP